MLTWKTGVVEAHGRAWPGAQELTIEIDGTACRGLAYTELTGVPDIGERVTVTADALDLGLGTGGYVFVAGRQSPISTPPAGHLMKARYTPMQVAIQGVDEQGTEHYGLLRDADDIGGMPVVTADLHSSLPAIITGIHHMMPNARIVYVHTDTAALPLWFSRLAATLRSRGDIHATITAGQSFGGDFEAVNLYTALLAAKHVVGADITIAIHGPGNVGTGSTWGFTGTACGEIMNATATLGGTPIGTLRVSAADPRERHQGLSHHSVTAYTRVTHVPITIPVTTSAPAEIMADVESYLPQFTDRGHSIDTVATEPLHDKLAGDPLLRSMGRSYEEDPSPFMYAAAAGMVAARYA